MTDVERWREAVSEFPSEESAEKRRKDGWRLVAVEWERESKGAVPVKEQRPIPYGLRISTDCQHLEIDPAEKEVLALIIAMIAGDQPLSRIASALNERGSRTRAGAPWTQLKIFQMLPRVIEVGPEILSREEWSESKKRLLAAVS